MLVWVITLVIVTWKITATETSNIGSVKRSTTLWTSAPPPLPSILCYILGNSWKHPLPKKALLKNHIPLQNHRSPPKILRLSIYRFRERAEHSLDWSILTSTVTQIGIWKLPPPPHHHQKGFVSKTQTLQCHKAHTPQVSGRLRLHYC